ncbi:dTMP kinase [Paraphotobacterium marinum]|uniref:Thymidylate kinase n=1 Tax=Paraphotobacterium marinum TaxID=1755811 RepID=A0A220VBK3_9GAMM|nr:dTMP kinase [Paraphotobacterium marinum]ASK77661.1 dTMP kinase [Paraphotobacterium marinum]
MKNKAKFIVVEGLEGAGKSTAINYIYDLLLELGITNVQHTREPGGTLISEEIRRLFKKEFEGENLTAISEVLLIFSARSQLIESVIRPCLNEGIWILADRHNLSTIAYQGGGRNIPIQEIKSIQRMVCKNLEPDLTIFLDVSPEIGLSRARLRSKLDRIEKEDIKFFNKVRSTYRNEINELNHDVILIDSNKELDIVKQEIKQKLFQWFKNTKG